MANLERYQVASLLPSKPNHEMAETLVYDVYAGELTKNEFPRCAGDSKKPLVAVAAKPV